MQMDVEVAFLNGSIKTEVYVKQPIGFDYESGQVYKLQKALYGLRESWRVWNKCLNDFLKSLGFVKSNNDYDIQ